MTVTFQASEQTAPASLDQALPLTGLSPVKHQGWAQSFHVHQSGYGGGCGEGWCGFLRPVAKEEEPKKGTIWRQESRGLGEAWGGAGADEASHGEEAWVPAVCELCSHVSLLCPVRCESRDQGQDTKGKGMRYIGGSAELKG